MTAQSHEKTTVRRAETGWSRARRLRGKGALRTWVPAVADRDVRRGADGTPDDNIVRGED